MKNNVIYLEKNENYAKRSIIRNQAWGTPFKKLKKKKNNAS